LSAGIARSFVLEDASGATRAILAVTADGPSLVLSDANDTPRAALSDTSGNPRAGIGVTATGPVFVLSDTIEKPRVTLAATPGGPASLLLFATDGTLAWRAP